ncbi:Uncharacterized membrane protein YsdA, DUF1294 family [Aeromonas sp. RU39B]|jgi:uncharacterized membrane protein YsdA (DUF1294 family)|uniref:DUF1294 domain-containing protein n=1 Tax=Aeromonas sp. RU39B TaxID=1907416 RepID=UPI0009566E4E|nr:DUF1294 domain-containing protein [Aeromonas sp. RU39B]SIR23055.1 Uncharacterized membrane protein YsdA, DUF1294 family [Aeromonas sp. RU39B]
MITFPALLALTQLCALPLLVLTGMLPIWLAGLYAVMSLLTFLVYGWDKRAAQRKQSRVAERTLHTWAWLGGWPGALLARQLLRHKSSKKEYKLPLWLSVGGNLLFFAALLWWCNP